MSAPAAPRWALGSGAQIAHALVLAMLLVVAMFLVIQGWLRPLVLGPDFESAGPYPALFVLFGLAVLSQTVLVIWLGLVRIGRVSLRELGWREKNVRGDILWGLAGFLAVTVVVLVLSAVLGRSADETLADWQHRSAGVRLLGLGIGLLVAFNEETLFRGYLQGGLVARLGPVLGVIVTALVFALNHGNLRPMALLARFLLGLIFGVIAFRRRSLFPGALAHGLTWAVIGLT